MRGTGSAYDPDVAPLLVILVGLSLLGGSWLVLRRGKKKLAGIKLG